jgi:chemotaxis protein methyltransferase CheR
MIRKSRTAFRTAYRLVKFELLYGTLLYRYGMARHDDLLKRATKSQNHTYTRFCRSPGQLEALAGPVMRALLESRSSEKFRVHVFASSSGAESYTLASTLFSRFPELDFEITASDHDSDMLDHARSASYTSDEVHYWGTSNEFVDQTFDRVGDSYVVKPEIRARVSFQKADLLDSGRIREFGEADLVFMQNVLCHLDPEPAALAFRNVAQLLKPGSALFLDGMSLDQREALTAEAGLVPLDFKVREIHEFARSHVGERWWNYYYGFEPYASWHRNRIRRFSTIFFNNPEQGKSEQALA